MSNRNVSLPVFSWLFFPFWVCWEILKEFSIPFLFSVVAAGVSWKWAVPAASSYPWWAVLLAGPLTCLWMGFSYDHTVPTKMHTRRDRQGNYRYMVYLPLRNWHCGFYSHRTAMAVYLSVLITILAGGGLPLFLGILLSPWLLCCVLDVIGIGQFLPDIAKATEDSLPRFWTRESF